MRLAAGIIAALLLSACQSTTAADGSLDVSLFDGSIDASSDSIKAGTVAFNAQNHGEFSHTLVVTTASGDVLAATGLIDSSEGEIVTLELAPGRYELTCRIVSQLEDGSIIDHFEEGMRFSLTVET